MISPDHTSFFHKTSRKLRKASLTLLHNSHSASAPNSPTASLSSIPDSPTTSTSTTTTTTTTTTISSMPSKIFSYRPASMKRNTRSTNLPWVDTNAPLPTPSSSTITSPVSTYTPLTSQPSSPSPTSPISSHRLSSQTMASISSLSSRPSTPIMSFPLDDNDFVSRIPLELFHQILDIILSDAVDSLLHTPSPKFMKPGYEHRVRAIFGRPTLNIFSLMLTSKHVYTYITSQSIFAEIFLFYLLNSFSPFSRDFNAFTIPLMDHTPRATLTVRAIRGRAFPQAESLKNVLSCRYDTKSMTDIPPAVLIAQRAYPKLFTLENMVYMVQIYGAHHGNDIIFERATNREDILDALEVDFSFEVHENLKGVDAPACLVWRPEVPMVTEEWKILSQYGSR